MAAHTVTHAAFVEALAAAGAAVISSKVELTKLDAAAGDGDLGATMERGFRAVRVQLTSDPPAHPAAALRQVGEVLSSKAPSTMGTLLGAGLTMAAGSVQGRDELDGADVAGLLASIGASIAELGQARAGQRTVLDAILPAAERARELVDGGEPDAQAVLRAACDAADAGVRETAEMTASVGRARWTGDRSAGVVDGGARAFAIWLRGLANGLPPNRPRTTTGSDEVDGSSACAQID